MSGKKSSISQLRLVVPAGGITHPKSWIKIGMETFTRLLSEHGLSVREGSHKVEIQPSLFDDIVDVFYTAKTSPDFFRLTRYLDAWGNVHAN